MVQFYVATAVGRYRLRLKPDSTSKWTIYSLLKYVSLFSCQSQRFRQIQFKGEIGNIQHGPARLILCIYIVVSTRTSIDYRMNGPSVRSPTAKNLRAMTSAELRYKNETIPTILLDFRSQQILSFLASVAGKELGDNDIIISCSQLFTRYILLTIRTNPTGPSYFLSQGIASSTALELLSLRGNNGPCLVLKVRNGRIRRILAYIRY